MQRKVQKVWRMWIFLFIDGLSEDTLENDDKTKGEKGSGWEARRSYPEELGDTADNLSFFQRKLHISFFIVGIVMSRFWLK